MILAVDGKDKHMLDDYIIFLFSYNFRAYIMFNKNLTPTLEVPVKLQVKIAKLQNPKRNN